MNSVPLELRRRIVEAYERNEGTYFELAQRFGVGEATVYRLVRLKRERGDVKIGPARGISEEELPAFVELVRRSPGATLEQLKRAWIAQTRHELSLSSIARALQRAGISRQNVSGRRGSPGQALKSARQTPVEGVKKRERVG